MPAAVLLRAEPRDPALCWGCRNAALYYLHVVYQQCRLCPFILLLRLIEIPLLNLMQFPKSHGGGLITAAGPSTTSHGPGAVACSLFFFPRSKLKHCSDKWATRSPRRSDGPVAQGPAAASLPRALVAAAWGRCVDDEVPASSWLRGVMRDIRPHEAHGSGVQRSQHALRPSSEHGAALHPIHCLPLLLPAPDRLHSDPRTCSRCRPKVSGGTRASPHHAARGLHPGAPDGLTRRPGKLRGARGGIPRGRCRRCSAAADGAADDDAGRSHINNPYQLSNYCLLLPHLQARPNRALAEELAAPSAAPGPEAGAVPAPAPAEEVALFPGAALLDYCSSPTVYNCNFCCVQDMCRFADNKATCTTSTRVKTACADECSGDIAG